MTLEAKQLVCGYGNQPIGPECTSRWDLGGIHAIIGANGAGKSTLVRTLCGLQRPVSGVAEIGAQSIHGIAALERAQKIAYVHSTPPSATGLTASEVLGLMEDNEALQKLEIERLGRAAWLHSRMSELSDGQRQRVMIVRALLQRTPWIVLDEPTAFLDARARTELFSVLDELAGVGKGIIIATHDLHLLERSNMLASVHVVGASWSVLPPDAGVKIWESAC